MSETTKTGVDALDELFAAVNRSDAPGLVVGVAQHGRPVYRRGFGLASIELGVANTAWTRMRIGSTSKHFTCLAALLLAEDGKLDIDAGVRTYVPELPLLEGEPTLRQLMNHSGGHRCYLDVGFLSDAMAIKPTGVALRTQVRQGDVNFAPGDKTLYNNGGYHLLSLIVERVSGMPFEQFLEERIFRPLGMVDTKSVPSDFEIHRNMATLHVAQPDGRWRRGIFPTEEVRGEGAMISTIDDMLRWLAHLRGPHTVGSDHTWKQMTTPVRLNNGSTVPYALGLMVHGYRGVRVVHHAGGVIGGTCQMLTVPDHALDIIIMTNGAVVSAVELANRIVDTMLGDEVLAAREERASIDRFKSVLGKRYHAPSTGLLAGFGDAGGKLGICLMNNPPVPLRDEGDTLRLGFEDIAMGPFTLRTADIADRDPPPTLEITESGHVLRLELLPDAAPADAVAPLAGRYRAADLGADALILQEGEAWKLRIFGQYAVNELALEALSADVVALSHAVHPQLRAALSVDRRDGVVTGFRVDSGRTRGMRFERIGD
ncbi:serine hydrolase domain-containing protein [Scleromatobacter humisilvae]|uniref:Beta-lactamase family protein n=1 Tax=Scleromatobacter humisilvae TaxID=2897159 RepID=A0A9X1YLQ3_9BURK|nr:serine hydrolase domain-containing protein [Scleromatobacter humisilvae]MCK9688634.1 beta-lactamase family protein [Scleromatobacter humisilvae]